MTRVSFVLVLQINRPECRAIFVVEIHSGCDEGSSVCLHIGPHHSDSGVYSELLILGAAERAKREHRKRNHE